MNSGTINLSTSSRLEYVDITDRLQTEISAAGCDSGVCYVYNPHTTAGVTINEGADPAVRRDIISALQKIVPADHPYRHLEGNSPAHIMTTMTGSSVTIFLKDGKLQLGTWQRLFFTEYDGPRTRKVLWKVLHD